MFDAFETISLTTKQIEEALSKENAYFFFLKHGRAHQGPMELIRYYLAEGLHLPVHEFKVDEEQGELFI